MLVFIAKAAAEFGFTATDIIRSAEKNEIHYLTHFLKFRIKLQKSCFLLRPLNIPKS